MTLRRSNLRIRRLSLRAVEWPTVGLLLACYGLWFATGLYVYPAWPVVALAMFSIIIALHSSLQHEVLHGHPTRNRHVNEGLVFLPLSVFYPYRRYQAIHLTHHADERLTDPYDDPESFYRAHYDWAKLPRPIKTLLGWNNTFIGRITIGPALALPGFLVAEARQLASRPKIRKAWMLHAVELAGLSLVVDGVFGVPLWFYLISAYGGLSIIAVRSYCEHQWSERPDGRTIIVEKSLLSLLFLNNNLHLVHHKRPTVPWYKLPALYAEQREQWRAMNDGYVFANYLEIFRAFAFRSKEPVVHPVLRRSGAPIVLPPQHERDVATQPRPAMPVPTELPELRASQL